MRIILILITILAAMATAQAATPECAGVQDSLLRLRCYDDAAKVKPNSPSTKGVTPLVANYGAYPAAAPYRGPTRMPDFAGRDREYAMFRTRLRDGIRSGANFASHLALIQFGCGTGCSVVYVADVRTGQVYPFPTGGEDAQALGLEYRPTSNLIAAQWEDVEKNRCITAHYVWTGHGFNQIARRDIGPREACWEKP